MTTDLTLTLPEHLTSLATSAFTLTVDVGCWTAQKADSSIAKKISGDANASQQVGKWAHDLFVRDPELKAVHNHRQSVYNWLERPGTSYEFKGRERLVPNTSAETVIEMVKNLHTAFWQKVDIFLDGDAARGIPDYDAKIAAQAFVRGDLFRRSDYPSKEAVRSKFRFDWYVGRVREDDFRNVVSRDLADDLLVHMRRQHERVLDNLATRQQEQLVSLLESLSHTCTMEETDDGQLRFRRLHASTIDKALSVASTFEQFNPSGDPRIASASAALRAALAGYGSEDGIGQLRESEVARERVKRIADDLLDTLRF